MKPLAKFPLQRPACLPCTGRENAPLEEQFENMKAWAEYHCKRAIAWRDRFYRALEFVESFRGDQNNDEYIEFRRQLNEEQVLG